MKICSLMTFFMVLAVGVPVSIGGLANALGQADEKTPIVDSWMKGTSQMTRVADARVDGRQIVAKTTEGVAMRRAVNSDAATPGSEAIAKEFDGVKSVKNDSAVATPPLRKALGVSEDSTAMNVKELPNSAVFMPAVSNY